MPYQCKRCGSLIVKHACGERLMDINAAPPMSPPSSSHASPMLLQREVAPRKRLLDVHVYGRERGSEEPTARPHSRVFATAAQVALSPHRQAYAQTREATLTCKNCGGAGASMTHGLRWSDCEERCMRMPGELLCENCRRSLCDELEEYIPAPPERPGCYQIVRTRLKERVSLAQGVTLLCVSGRYTEAKALKDTKKATVCRSRVS
jgi:hypothetical protein